MRFSIRTALTPDIAALRYVYRRSSLSNRGDRDNLLAHPEALHLGDAAVEAGYTRVAIVAGRIVGFATAIPGDGVVELDDLFVDPDFMRRGIGRGLVEDVVTMAVRHGAARIQVTANYHAIPFYVAVGFVPDDMTQTELGPAPRMYLEVPVIEIPQRATARADEI